MIRLFKYNLNSEFESNKETLNQLDNYVALTDDNQTIHYKPLPNIFYITTNNTGTTIYKRNIYDNEQITLNNGENKLTDWNYGFYFNYTMKQNQITSFDFSKYNTSNITIMNDMFSGCTNLASLDLSNFDTSNVNSMNEMFRDCSGLTKLDVSNFDTTKVTNMLFLFLSCTNLTSLDLSSFDTSNVTNMQSMFMNCTNLASLDLSKFDTSKLNHYNMGYMFSNCNKLTYIKCKQAFKDWCLTNQDDIDLPTAMRDGGNGNWEIV